MSTPGKVLITDGREIGGLAAFAAGLSEGFTALGIPSEVVPPNQIFKRSRDLRDPRVLKVLSTTAVFAAPVARRAICVAHGFPSVAYQGLARALCVIGSFKLAKLSSRAPIVTVSHYSAVHLKSVFDLKVDAVIHNPLRPLFLEPFDHNAEGRDYITYVGRLHPAKNLHQLIPAIRDLLKETGLRACFIGDGEQRAALEEQVDGNEAFQFTRTLDSREVRKWLRRTRIFVSGCETEALGISYLEALSQGCVVAMPASGGGLEVALDQIGRSVHLLPLSFNRAEVLSVLRRSVASYSVPTPMAAYSPEEVAKAYLRLDSRFSLTGKFMGYEEPLSEDVAA